MQKLLFITITAFLFASCGASKMKIKVSAGHDASEPGKGNFVQMKNGAERALPDELEVKSGDLELNETRMIKVGNQKIKGKEVAAIQINGDYYKNTDKKSFSRRIYRGGEFDVYTHTNISQHTSTNFRPGSGFGGGYGSSMTTTSRNVQTVSYSLHNPKLNDGKVLPIRSSGEQRELDQYLKGYKPSLDIMEHYRQQRKVSRIVKYSTLGLWLTSIPMMMMSKGSNTLGWVGLGNLFAGFIYTPAMAFGFKYRNRARPYQAVQTYIDNNLMSEPLTSATKELPKQESVRNPDAVAKVDTDAAAMSTVNNTLAGTSDFIELNNNEIIEANPGTKLRSANNKIFFINDKKYTSGVTAFRVNKKLFRHFPDMSDKDDFAQKSIDGKIDVYNVVKGTSQNNANTNSVNFMFGKKEYFTKDGEQGYLKGRNRIASYVEDNAKVADLYGKYKRHYNRTVGVYAGLTAITLGSVAALIATGISSGDPSIAWGIVGAASSIAAVAYIPYQTKKLNREFVAVMDAYNGTKKAKGKRTVNNK